MRIISKRTLEEYCANGHEDARVPLGRWHTIAKKAEWHTLADMKRDFPSVDYVGNQRYVFNIHGNNYRLVVLVRFTPGQILIRWVGTHAEYDKIDCRTI